jgi:hypothetical protein
MNAYYILILVIAAVGGFFLVSQRRGRRRRAARAAITATTTTGATTTAAGGTTTTTAATGTTPIVPPRRWWETGWQRVRGLSISQQITLLIVGVLFLAFVVPWVGTYVYTWWAENFVTAIIGSVILAVLFALYKARRSPEEFARRSITIIPLLILVGIGILWFFPEEALNQGFLWFKSQGRIQLALVMVTLSLAGALWTYLRPVERPTTSAATLPPSSVDRTPPASEKKKDLATEWEVGSSVLVSAVLAFMVWMILMATPLAQTTWFTSSVPVPKLAIAWAVLIFFIWFVHEGMGFILWTFALVAVVTNFAATMTVHELLVKGWNLMGPPEGVNMYYFVPIPWLVIGFLFPLLWLMVTAKGYKKENGNKWATGVFFAYLQLIVIVVANYIARGG